MVVGEIDISRRCQAHIARSDMGTMCRHQTHYTDRPVVPTGSPNTRSYLGVTNVLISGGAGFLGSHLAHNLAARDYRVTVLDNLSAQIHGENPPICGATERYTFLKGDVRSREDCRSTTW